MTVLSSCSGGRNGRVEIRLRVRTLCILPGSSSGTGDEDKLDEVGSASES